MSSASDADEALADFLSCAFTLSCISLVIYDSLLTFSREVNCIWKRRFSVVTVLCNAAYIIYAISTALNMFSTSFISLLRVWAIYQQRWAPVLVILPLAMFAPCANIYHLVFTRVIWLPDGTCGSLWVGSIKPLITFPFPPVTRATVIATDLLVVVFIWVKTLDLWTLREIRAKGFTAPLLTTVFIRNGTLYFLALLAINLTTLVITELRIQLSSFIFISTAVSANLSARFFLDLRMVYFQKADPSLGRVPSSVRFAQLSANVAGNIGAPVGGGDSTWVVSAGDDSEEEPEYLAVPIMAGISSDSDSVVMQDMN
ncbi:hypothetical protein BXZ70DRAFT_905459 [Cristinia sonorae]|uniref:DUF6533 domain-containing protein n=1 Tax=Cristinia sonorae TaxID=1940300 RepID=A0A8K0UU69_9AGAR|nr:hypothetical protein BXZ70DRAFT_905459 [Cristinia sonorae]